MHILGARLHARNASTVARVLMVREAKRMQCAKLERVLTYVVVVAASGEFLFGGPGGFGLPCGFRSKKLNFFSP